MYLDIEVLFKVFIFWQLSLMLEPSYTGSKMGDTRITKIHHLITAERFLSWKHFNLNLLIKLFLQTLLTNVNSILKGRFWYSFILCTPHLSMQLCIYLSSIYLSAYLPTYLRINIAMIKKKKSRLNLQQNRHVAYFPTNLTFIGGTSDRTLFIIASAVQSKNSSGGSIFWRNGRWNTKQLFSGSKNLPVKRIAFLLLCGEFSFIM